MSKYAYKKSRLSRVSGGEKGRNEVTHTHARNKSINIYTYIYISRRVVLSLTKRYEKNVGGRGGMLKAPHFPKKKRSSSEPEHQIVSESGRDSVREEEYACNPIPTKLTHLSLPTATGDDATTP